MRRTIYTFFIMVLFGCLPALAADNPVVGKWQCGSDDGSGHNTAWTLVVQEEAGKLSGSLIGDDYTIPLVDPKLEGSVFTFKFKINPNCTVDATTKIEGTSLQGKFSCPEVSGTLKGTKKS